jgi:hypothetical protein
MDEEKDRLLTELSRLRFRVDEIGRRLKELDRQERRSRLRVLPGGAAALTALATSGEKAATVSVANVAYLLAIPGGRVTQNPRALPPSPRVPLDLDRALHVGLEIDQFPKDAL